jgi:hypothetical protein
VGIDVLKEHIQSIFKEELLMKLHESNGPEDYSQESSINIATSYRLDGHGSIPGRGNIFLLHSIHTGSPVIPASYPKGTRIYYPRGKVDRV